MQTVDLMDKLTEPFTVSPTVYAFAYARRRAGRTMVLPGLFVAGLLIAGLYDVRFVILALMLLLLVVPLLYLFGWLSLSSRPEILAVTRPQQWHFDLTSNTFTVHFHACDDREATEEPLSVMTVTANDVRDLVIGSRYSVIELSEAFENEFLLIPTKILPGGYSPEPK